ncbi:outer membrane beta-barrel protein [Fulvivirgaceae bacterium BMA10]|uniref:Outer membrane beta-barrel protein n=1 Tax=Splendidivirga corallicola TaxID=3051826 RepID=A0ABT8KQF5_9BACT|nr:outer membrane beta-barrel protein [Fulvivirgaceae bacterium BMA10]
MKLQTRTLLTLAGIIILNFNLTIIEANGQGKGDITVGGGLAFRTLSFSGVGDVPSFIGINARGSYQISDNIILAPDLTFFFPKTEGTFDWNIFEFNANGNYLFTSTGEGLQLYALAGLNFTRVKYDFEGIGGFGGFGGSFSDTNVGFNLGGGLNYPINDNVAPFAELKFTVAGYDGFGGVFGVKFKVN